MLLGPRYIEEIKRYHAALQSVYIRGQRYSISAGQQIKGIEFCLAKLKHQRPRKVSTCLYITRPSAFVGKKAYKAAYYDKWEWCASNNLRGKSQQMVDNSGVAE